MEESIATRRHGREFVTLEYVVTAFRAFSIPNVFRFDGLVRQCRGDIVMREKMLSKIYFDVAEYLTTHLLDLQQCNVAIPLSLEYVLVCVDTKIDKIETNFSSRHKIMGKVRSLGVYVSVYPNRYIPKHKVKHLFACDDSLYSVVPLSDKDIWRGIKQR